MKFLYLETISAIYSESPFLLFIITWLMLGWFSATHYTWVVEKKLYPSISTIKFFFIFILGGPFGFILSILAIWALSDDYTEQTNQNHVAVETDLLDQPRDNPKCNNLDCFCAANTAQEQWCLSLQQNDQPPPPQTIGAILNPYCEMEPYCKCKKQNLHCFSNTLDPDHVMNTHNN